MEMDQLKEFIDLALKEAESKADDFVARVTSSTRNQIRFSNGLIDINKQWETCLLELLAVVEQNKVAISQVPVSDEISIRNTVQNTIAFAHKLPSSPLYLGIEDRNFQYPTIPDSFDSEIDNFVVKAPEFINSTIQASVNAGAKRVAGSFLFGKNECCFGTSKGLTGSLRDTSYELTIRSFQEELESSGQGIACGRIPTTDLKEMEQAGIKAGELSKQAIGGKQGEPGVYDVIMDPTVAANVIGGIAASANPLMILMGMSPLQDKMGQQLAPNFITIHEAPHQQNGLSSTPFDFEGTKTQNTSLFSKGVFTGVVHNTSSARMFETESTGNSFLLDFGGKFLAPAATNIVFEPGNATLEELFSFSTKKALYITSNWYTRFTSQVDGDFSSIPRDGMFIVENGEIKKPVRNLRLSDNLLRMFKSIQALGKEVRQIKWWEVPSPVWIPPMRIEECRMTAATQ
ncbi:MAG: TldD/PmbA family protein [Candidatus Hodarchaeota archaeon]